MSSRPATAARKTPPATKARAASIDFIASGEAIALFKGIELGAQAARHLADWLRSEGPLVVQVLEAARQAGDYRVRLRLTNQTVHGLVLLGASLAWPAAIEALALQRPAAGEGAGEGGEGEAPAGGAAGPLVLPLLLPSARPLEVEFVFPLPGRPLLEAGLLRRRAGKLALRYQRLDQAVPTTRAVAFAIVLPD